MGSIIKNWRNVKNGMNLSQKFLDKIFTESEINSSRQRSSISSHLAGKFAAKEAVKKAILSSGLVENISIKDIEVLSLQSGAPVIKLNLDIKYEFINDIFRAKYCFI